MNKVILVHQNIVTLISQGVNEKVFGTIAIAISVIGLVINFNRWQYDPLATTPNSPLCVMEAFGRSC
jgi:hypothetical protein